MPASLFVFSLSDPKQNARSLLTPVSGTVFYALSHGSLGFALHGSFLNHFLIGPNNKSESMKSAVIEATMENKMQATM